MRIIRCRSLMHFYFSDKSVFLILSLIRRIMDGDTESSSNPIRRNVSVSVSSAPSSPQMPTQHPSLCPLSTTILTSEGLLHGVNHKYYPVSDSACRLQVYIVSDRLSRSKRNQPLSLKITDHNCRRCLDHNTEFHILIRNAVGIKSRFHFRNDFFDLFTSFTEMIIGNMIAIVP